MRAAHRQPTTNPQGPWHQRMQHHPSQQRSSTPRHCPQRATFNSQDPAPHPWVPLSSSYTTLLGLAVGCMMQPYGSAIASNSAFFWRVSPLVWPWELRTTGCMALLTVVFPLLCYITVLLVLAPFSPVIFHDRGYTGKLIWMGVAAALALLMLAVSVWLVMRYLLSVSAVIALGTFIGWTVCLSGPTMSWRRAGLFGWSGWVDRLAGIR